MTASHSLPDHDLAAEDGDFAEHHGPGWQAETPGRAAADGPAAEEDAAEQDAAEQDPDVLILAPDQYTTEPAREPATETVPDPIDEPAAAPRAATLAEPAATLAEPAVPPAAGTLIEPAGNPPDDAFAADIPPTNPDYRWREIQAMFVDDPRGSVERAADLARDTLRDLSSMLQAREQDLRSTWQDGSADTEALRTSLQAYRSLVDQISGLAPPTGK